MGDPIRIAGYACVFDVADLAGDRVAPTAFDMSLKLRGASDIPMLWEHDPARPIGRWTAITVGAFGLRVEGLVDADAGRMADVFFADVTGLSIGYHALRSRPGDNGFGRRLLEVVLWEISLVAVPMQPNARFEIVSRGEAAA